MNKSIPLLLAISSLVATRSASQWVQTNGPYGGSFFSPVFALCNKDSSLFVGTEQSGAYRSTDNGVSWVSINSGLADLNVTAIASSGGRLYAGTGDGVYISNDNGMSWVSSSGNTIQNGIRTIAVNGKNVFVGTDTWGIFRSTNQGKDWESASAGLPPWSPGTGGVYSNIGSIEIVGNKIIAGTGQNGVYVSTDNGSNWRPSGLEGISVICFCINGSTISAGTVGGVFVSTDSCASWIQANNGLGSTTVLTLAASEDKLFAGTESGIFASSDNGQTWISASIGLLDPYVRELVCYDHMSFAAGNGGVFKSTDDGLSWKPANEGLTFAIVNDLVSSSGRLFIASQYNGIFASEDTGKSWSTMNGGMPMSNVQFIRQSGINVLAGGDSGLFVTVDQGQSWKRVYNLPTSCVTADVSGDTERIFVGGKNGLSISCDTGKTWDVRNHGLLVPFINSVAADKSPSGNIQFCGTTWGVYRSFDYGQNWTYCGLNGLSIFSLYVHDGVVVADAGVVPTEFTLNKSILSSDDAGIFVSKDWGETWTPANLGLPVARLFKGFAFKGDSIFIGGNNGGVYVSTLKFPAWYRNNQGLADTRITSLVTYGPYLFAGSQSSGVWKIPINEISLGVRDKPISILNSFHLDQNYPNPFNPSTTIRFSIAEKSLVRITIFDVLGQQIAELANEEMSAGNFEKTWNANVASGIYFYRLEAVSISDPNKRFVEVKKMVLLK